MTYSEIMQAVVGLAQIITTIAIVFTFFVYRKQHAAMQDQVIAARDSSRTQNLISIIDYIHRPEHRQARFTLINLENVPYESWTQGQKLDAERACSCWDTVALLLRNTNIPNATDLIIGHWRHSIRICFVAAAPLIHETRTVREIDFWDDFEWLGEMANSEATIKPVATQQVVAADAVYDPA